MAAPPALYPSPEVGMIANCDWPNDGKPPRPVLVVDVEEENGVFFVGVVYGTGQPKGTKLKSHELLALKDVEKGMNLDDDTRFVFDADGIKYFVWNARRFGFHGRGEKARRGVASEAFMQKAMPLYQNKIPSPQAKIYKRRLGTSIIQSNGRDVEVQRTKSRPTANKSEIAPAIASNEGESSSLAKRPVLTLKGAVAGGARGAAGLGESEAGDPRE